LRHFASYYFKNTDIISDFHFIFPLLLFNSEEDGAYSFILLSICNGVGYAVAQVVEALRYKPEGRGFDSRWCHWNFSLT
jgi:hypothetical protein